ncbi:MAG: protein kinase [Polyangiaceae bacterium]|nr:protein kinase [Polyangiaceae bacterium]
MSCLDETQIVKLLVDDLPPHERLVIDAHVDTCARCRMLLADLARLESGNHSKQLGDSNGTGLRLSRDDLTIGSASASPVDIGPRYRLKQLIGQGGMGRVYRAVDRIGGHDVALKRVIAWDPTNASLSALAREFRVLATLRHPHIIGVLDYGFDAARQPFFTMELLDGARPILPAALLESRTTQIELIVQILRATSYLHRRGVLHRDLKPTNILLTSAGVLKVVDFGLAAADDSSRRVAAGTLPYMAPELFQRHPATESSDIYSIGVIAYEVMIGKLPFQPSATMAELVTRIVDEEPDLSVLPSDVRAIIGRALRKNPADRPASAHAFMEELLAATHETSTEPAIVRDSYLVAAQFTGRNAEITRLRGVLEDARAGRGSAWLVGGESGVGKSRLLEELRAEALVNGVLVVRGQASSTGDAAFHVFRSVLDVIALHVPLSELEAGVLEAVVPNLSILVEREVSPPPALDPPATRFRLRTVLRDVLLRSDEPVLILLEDLQWADEESLSLLAEISENLQERKVLLVGTYRNDEASALPASLPAMAILQLERFDLPNITRLCSSMVGAAGQNPEFVERIARETEGNAFFIVEVMRALAEVSGRLEDLIRRGLPERIAPGGMDRVLEQRLSRVPNDGRELLELAALAGRELDLDLLSVLVPRAHEYVLAGANAGVFDAHEDRYRYNHDKLREYVIRGIDDERRRSLHGRLADALCRSHPNSSAHAARKAFHFREAKRWSEAIEHDMIAGEAALDRGAPAEALAAFERIAGTPGYDDLPILARIRTRRGMAVAHHGLGRLDETDESLRRVAAMTNMPLPSTPAQFYGSLGVEVAEQFLRRIGMSRVTSIFPRNRIDETLRTEHLLALNTIAAYWWLGRPEIALLTTLRGLNLQESLSVDARQNHGAALALLLSYTPLHDLSRWYLNRVARGTRPGSHAEVIYLCSKAGVEVNEGKFADALQSANRALELALQHKDQIFALEILLHRSFAAAGVDDFECLDDTARQMEHIAMAVQNPRFQALALISRASARLRFGEPAAADECLARARTLLSPSLVPPLAMLLGLSATCALMLGQFTRALELADEGMKLVIKAPFPRLTLRLPLNCFIDVYLAVAPERHEDEIRTGLDTLRKMMWESASVEPILLVLEGRYQYHRGDPARAVASMKRAVETSHRQAMRYDQAVALYALGCFGCSHTGSRLVPESGRRYLERALAMFEGLRAQFEAEKTRAALLGRRFSPSGSPRSAWYENIE